MNLRTRTRGSVLGLTVALSCLPVVIDAPTASATLPTPSQADGTDTAALLGELRANTGDRTTIGTADDGAVTFIGGSTERPLTAATSAGIDTVGRAFVDRYAPLFGVADPARDLVQSQVFESPDAGGAVRFDQTIAGVPVIAGQVVVQVSTSGAVLSASGEATNVRGVATTPIVAQSDAEATAVALTSRASGVGTADLRPSVSELAVFDPDLLGLADTLGVRLVWHVEVRAADGSVDRYVLVDATDGTVALDFSQIAHALDRSVCDNHNDIAISATCAPGSVVRAEGQAPVVDGPNVEAADVNMAYDLSGGVYDFYLSRFGRDSLDGLGMPLVSTVRHCEPGYACPFANAYWNGVQMVYGDDYATADDVVAHELTHGLTNFTSNLIYLGQSGALNESMSDIMGELFDQTNTISGPDSPADRWKMGEQLPIGAIRNMANPLLFNNPDRMTSPQYYLGLGDSRGVHLNSGVSNKAAQLIVDGGPFNGQTITGLGVDKAALIYYQLETTLLTRGSDYLDVFRALPQACTNLVGVGGITAGNCDEVRKAVIATEMDLRPGATGVAVPECSSGVLNALAFSDDMETDSGQWMMSNTGNSAVWQYSTKAWQSGTRSMWVADKVSPSGVSTLTMQQPVAVPTAGASYFRFEHSFNTDYDDQLANVYFDGGVVEYSTDGGSTWKDIAAAPALPTVNGYTGRISTSGYPTNAPGDRSALADRSAFGGYDSGFMTTQIDTSGLAGQSVAFRFRFATDNYPLGAFPGWFVDDVALYGCGSAVVPSTPPTPTATLAGRDATLTWTAPFDGGAPITSSVITPFRDGVPQPPITTSTAATTVTIPALDPGATYSFSVAAVNAAGAGSPSPRSNAVSVALVAPGAPTAVTASAGDGSALVSWTAPTFDGGRPVTGFVITPSRNGVALPAVTTDATASFRVNGLANGSAYTFTVSATSSIGTGAASAPTAPVTPQGVVFAPASRLLDSRIDGPTVDGLFSGVGLRAAGSTMPLTVLGRGGIAADAVAVVLNVTVTEAQGPGFVTVYPCGAPRPTASSVNFVAGQTIPNLVVTKVGQSGQVCLFTSVATHLVVDASSFFAPTAGLGSIVPSRVLETRAGLSTVDGTSNGVGRRTAGSTTEVQVGGRAGVPTDASSVIVNVAAVNPGGSGFVTVFPCGTEVPTASNLNFLAGQTIANAAIIKVGTGGKVCLFTNVATDLVVDMTGYFEAGSTMRPVVPARLLESRSSGATVDGQSQGIGIRPAGAVTEVVVAGRGGVPGTATAAVLNVTVTEPSGDGFATVYPCGTERPATSNLNYYASGATIANAVVTRIGEGGKVCIYTQRATHLVVDIDAYIAG